MYMTYTFYSRVLDAEETVTILMPHPHQVQNGRYTHEDLYDRRRALPTLFVMGDEGTENSWWMRHSFAEGDIHHHPCAVVGVRGMPFEEKTLRFVKDELPVLMYAQFPFDQKVLCWLGWLRSEAFSERLLADGPYERVLLGGTGADDVSPNTRNDCAVVLRQAIEQTAGMR